MKMDMLDFVSFCCLLGVLVVQSIAQSKFKSGEKAIKVVRLDPTIRRWGRVVIYVTVLPSLVVLAQQEDSFLRWQFAFPFEVRLAGLAISALGLSTFIWAHVALGANWSGVVRIRKGHELVTSGPFRYVRHPLYTGSFLLVGSASLTLEHAVVLVLSFLALAYYDIKARHEEVLLGEHFREEYTRYKARTWRFFPFVY